MNRILISAVLIVVFCISCRKDNSIIKQHRNRYNELEQLLSEKYFSTKEIGKKYLANEIIKSNDALYMLLEKEGILKKNSYFIYSNKDCISLVTRLNENSLGSFTDVLVTMNYNIGEFLCGINQVYTLNQDENVNTLDINSHNITGLMNVSIIRN